MISMLITVDNDGAYSSMEDHTRMTLFLQNCYSLLLFIVYFWLEIRCSFVGVITARSRGCQRCWVKGEEGK